MIDFLEDLWDRIWQGLVRIEINRRWKLVLKRWDAMEGAAAMRNTPDRAHLALLLARRKIAEELWLGKDIWPL